MTEYTPGPWRVYDADDFIVAAGDGFSICDCQPGNPFDVTNAQAVANARLIAAAPEMLEMLRHVVESGGVISQSELSDLAEMIIKAEVSS